MERSPILARLDEVRFRFRSFYVVVQALGLLAVCLIVYWAVTWHDGFAFDNKARQFNFHPVLMIVGMVYCYGNGVLVYRLFLDAGKCKVKIFHTVMQCFALLFMILALTAVFKCHIANGAGNLYSVHSWIGLSVFILFTLQFTMGFTAFLFPKTSEQIRTSLLPIHQFIGLLLSPLIAITIISGITEKLKDIKNLSSMPGEVLVLNILGIVVVMFFVLIGYLIVSSRYKRYDLQAEYHPMSE